MGHIAPVLFPPVPTHTHTHAHTHTCTHKHTHTHSHKETHRDIHTALQKKADFIKVQLYLTEVSANPWILVSLFLSLFPSLPWVLGWINDTRLFNRGAWCAQRDFETLWGHLTIRHIRRHGLFFLTDRWDQKRTPALHASLSLLIRRQSLFSAPSSLFLKGESLHLLAFFGVSFFVPDKALCIDYLESAAAYKKKVTTCHLYIAFGLYYGFQLPLWSCVTCWCIRQLPVEKTPLPNPWKIQIKCGVSSEVWCMLIRAAKENVLTLGILIAEKKKNQPSKPATPCYIKNGTAHQVFFFHDSEISHSTAFLLEVKKKKKNSLNS